MDVTPTQNNSHKRTNISNVVIFFILLIGVVSEYLSLILVLSKENIVKEPMVLLALNVCIFCMIIHHFFIIRNFHTISHLSDEENKKVGGVWITNSGIEKVIRLVLFVLFAFVSGEIIYILMILEKNMDLMNNNYFFMNPILHETQHKEYDISWITPFYIKWALILSSVMLFWDLAGFAYNKIKKCSVDYSLNNSIVTIPYLGMYGTFILTDAVAVVLWFSLKSLVENQNSNAGFVMMIFALIYFLLIASRLVLSLWDFRLTINSWWQYWTNITWDKFKNDL